MRIILVVLVCIMLGNAVSVRAATEDKLYRAWQALLSKHVDQRGAVSYQGFAQQRQQLKALLAAHAQLAVGKLSETAKKAIYINLYNAFMIECILRYAEENKIALTSKKFLQLEINSLRVSGGNIWSGDYRINLGGQMVNLDDIEHNLLRRKAEGKLASLRVKVLDPRLHTAINCAALSCPRLRRQAYTTAKIETMLEENMREFINAGKQLSWDAGRGKIVLNKILLWYYEDFETHGSKVLGKGGAGDYLSGYVSAQTAGSKQLVQKLRDHLNQRSKLALRFSRAFDFFYRWQINDVRNYKGA